MTDRVIGSIELDCTGSRGQMISNAIHEARRYFAEEVVQDYYLQVEPFTAYAHKRDFYGPIIDYQATITVTLYQKLFKD